MTYTPPDVQIVQQFEDSLIEKTPTLYPIIIGPRYEFLTYSKDKADAALGIYDKDNDVEYDYPKKTGILDPSKSILYFDDVYLRYFRKEISSTSYQFRVVYPHKNRLRSAANIDSNEIILANSTNRLGVSYTRSGMFLKDVQTGDGVYISATVGGVEYSIWSKVAALINDITPSTVGTPIPHPSNKTSQSHSIGAATDPAPPNTGGVTATSGGAYTGNLANGILNDTYTITVVNGGNYATQAITENNAIGDDILNIDSTSYWDHTQDEVYTISIIVGGTFGSSPGDARFTYTSNSGTDDGPVTGEYVGASGFAHSIGSYGLVINFTAIDGTLAKGSNWKVTCTAGTATLSIVSSSGTDDVSSYKARTDNFPIPLGTGGATLALSGGTLTTGDNWEVVCVAAFSAPTFTINGEYSGVDDLTYTLKVTKGGPWGECEITILSTGVDSSGPTIVEGPGIATTFGTRNLTVQFNTNIQGGLLENGKWWAAATAPTEGPIKTFQLQNNIPDEILDAEPTHTVSDVVPGDDDLIVTGTYTDSLNVLSERDTETYVVTITTGGAIGTAEYTVTSQSGLDDMTATVTSSGATNAIGSLGLMGEFTVTGGTLEIDQSWAVEVSKTNIAVDLHIIQNDVIVPRYRVDIPSDDAWKSETDKLTIEANIQLTDTNWKSGNTLVPIPVEKAQQYIAYSALKPDDFDYVGEISGTATSDEIDALLGRNSEDNLNPIRMGIEKALLNSNNRAIKYITLETDDEAGYQQALDIIKEYRDIYALVPMTQDPNVHQLCLSHVNALSQPTENRWRVALLSIDLPTGEYHYDTNNGADYLGTVEDDPLTSGTQYTLFIGQFVNFLTSDVSIGDTLEFNFHTDLNGNVVWDNYTIEEIRSETELIFTPALDTAITTPSKFRIKKVYSKQEQAEAIAALSLKDRRAMVVWPHQAGNNGHQLPGYHIAAAIGGMTAGNYPHQGFTNSQVLGFDDLSYSFSYFTRDQLNTIADGGFCIVTQTVRNSVPFIRHQLMSSTANLFDQEYSLVRTSDYISYYFWEYLQDIIGQYNITLDSIAYIRNRCDSVIVALKSTEYPKIGAPLIDGAVVLIAQNETFKDRVDIELDLTLPAPLNNLRVTLVFTL